jgi:hypothetical protein
MSDRVRVVRASRRWSAERELQEADGAEAPRSVKAEANRGKERERDVGWSGRRDTTKEKRRRSHLYICTNIYTYMSWRSANGSLGADLE